MARVYYEKMFDAVELGGTPERPIALETRQRRAIPNSQALAPDAQALRIAALIERRHLDWIKRKAPCGTYNCAGHVWASRRTAIYDEESYRYILVDDGYRRLRSLNEVRAGDLVIYRLKRPYRLIHVGMVHEVKGMFDATGVPFVISKWNDTSGEFLHHFEHVAFDAQFQRDEYDIEFWTDTERPAQR